MKTESELKTEFVNAIKRVDGWYATRIEDKFRVGIPDILIGVPSGPSLMVEAKRVARITFGPTARQWIELQRWSDWPTRKSLLLGFKEGACYLCYAAEWTTLSQCMPSLPGEPPHEFIMRFLHNVGQ